MMAGPGADASPQAVPSDEHARILVIGAGWLGSEIAAAWAARGAVVRAMSRSAAASSPVDEADHPAVVRPLRGDIVGAGTENGQRSLLEASSHGVDHVVLCVAPSRERGDSHTSLYPAAAYGALRLADSLGARSLLYTSSTGVYGATDGSVVDEDRTITPGDVRQQALLEAEDIVMTSERSSPLRRIVLRVAGLYGPGRDPARRFLGIAPDDDSASRWTNFAWRDDVVSAVLHLQTHLGAARAALFNCADGHPARARDIARALAHPAATANCESQPVSPQATASRRSAPATQQPPSSASAPAAARSNQRVSVERLLATGWSPTVPTVYDGLERLGHQVVRT